MFSELSNRYLYPAEDLFCKIITNFTYEHGSAVFNVFQLYVVHQVSTNPTYSSRIHRMQWILDSGNILWLFWDMKKIYPLTKSFFPHPLAFAAASASTIAAGTLLGIALNKHVKPSQNPQELLKDIEIPEPIQADIKIEWKRPSHQCFSQIIYCIALISNLALTYLSKYQSVYLINASSHAYCLWCISTLKWLRFSRFFNQNNRGG